MLENIKLALRIKTDVFDSELIGLIDACKKDLAIAGVNFIDDNDALINRAFILYCKANFGDNPECEKFMKAYIALKISLSLAGDYTDK